MTHPLPVLPVTPGAKISQVDTDKLVRHLEEAQPGMIGELIEAEKRPRDFSFYDVANRIAAYLREGAQGQVSPPASSHAMLDFLHELSRRARSAAGVAEVEPHGNPLVPNTPLPNLPVDEATTRLGVTQEICDRMLQEVYKKDPQLFLELAEQARRNIPMWSSESAFRAHWEPLLLSELTLNALIKSRMMMECRKRLRAMCGMA
ncbi:MAG TPA: hypothetical protein VEF76_02890 [Patescibacteria group bacterium]|nr:hypothetical protein [Patescibacteria group bacterium]